MFKRTLIILAFVLSLSLAVSAFTSCTVNTNPAGEYYPVQFEHTTYISNEAGFALWTGYKSGTISIDGQNFNKSISNDSGWLIFPDDNFPRNKVFDITIRLNDEDNNTQEQIKIENVLIANRNTSGWFLIKDIKNVQYLLAECKGSLKAAPFMPNLIHLNVQGDIGLDLSLLSKYNNLKSVYLNNYTNAKGSYNDLAQINNLTDLKISSLYNVSGGFEDIAELSTLKYFAAVNFEMQDDIGSLSTLSNLHSLHIYGENFTGSIDDLSGLINLQSLTIFNNRLIYGDVESLSHLPNLQSLKLQSAHGINVSLSSVANISSLSTLFIVGNFPKGALAELTALENITALYLDCEDVTGDLDDLKHFKNLEVLQIFDAETITGDIESLSELKELKNLLISGSDSITGNLSSLSQFNNLNKITLITCTNINGDLNSLSELTKLRDINIRNMTEITGNLSFIENLDNLLSLELSDLSVSGDLSSLELLNQIKYLSLSSLDNLTGDLDSLIELNNLKLLYLTYCNGITGNLRVMQDINTLKYVSVSGSGNLEGSLWIDGEKIKASTTSK